MPDLSQCETEPIHIPGSIQPHGVLLALRRPSLRIVQVSTSSQPLLGRAPKDLLERDLDSALGPALAAGVHGALARCVELPGIAASFAWAEPGAGGFSAFVHESGERIVLELLPSPPWPAPAPDEALEVAARAFRKVRAQPDVAGKLRSAAAWLREVTGYDRVMVYRFHPDWHGEVVAEARREDLQPYLGLHYPASDIPAQARRLFLGSPTRVIVDVNHAPAPLVPPLDPATGEPLDLSLSLLRSVSPVHLEYLRNMGVRASLVAALLREGALWGLISCQHGTPHPVPARIRHLVDWMAQDLGTQLAAAEQDLAQRNARRLRESHDQVVQAMRKGARLADLIRGPGLPWLLSALGAEGVALLQGEEVVTGGVTPDPRRIPGLSRALTLQGATGSGAFATECLSEVVPEAADLAGTAAGVGMYPLGADHSIRLLWFRGERARLVTWGGNPDKAVNLRSDGRIGPRQSFAAWTQSVHRRSLPWLPEELASARELGDLLDLELRRVAEDALRGSELMLANVVDSLTAHLAVLDHRGVIAAVNQAWKRFAELNGGSAQCLPGADYLAVCAAAVAFPGGAEAAAALTGIREVLAGTRASFTLEYPCSTPQEIRWFVMRVFPLTGGWRGAVVAHEEITTGKLAELQQRQAQAALDRERQRYLTLMTIAQDGIHLLDEEGLLVEANDAFLRKLELSRDVVGRLHVGDWDSGLPPEQLLPMVRSLILRPGLFQTRWRRADGATIEVEINAGGVMLEGRRFLLASARDITARKELEHQLAAKQAQLLELNHSLEGRVASAVAELRARDQLLITQNRQAAMGEMIGNIAHQWRQPLNALGLLLHNLLEAQARRSLDSAALEKAVQQGTGLVQRMSTTINDFRNFFRPDKARVAFAVRAQVEQAAALVDASFRSVGIGLQLQVPAELRVLGPPNEFAQVVLNLLVNAKDAIQASGVAGGQVVVRAEARDGEVLLSVRDNGGGIPPELLERIFEPFFSTRESGTGIGLYMSRTIVERSMGGRIEARNVEGGAELVVRCPTPGDEA